MIGQLPTSGNVQQTLPFHREESEMDDPDDIIDRLLPRLDKILSRSTIEDFGEFCSTLPPKELCLVAIIFLDMEINNGGYSQYLLNPTGGIFQKTREVSGLIGASRLKEQLNRIAEVIPNVTEFHHSISEQEIRRLVTTTHRRFLEEESFIYDSDVRQEAIERAGEFIFGPE